MSLEFFLIVNHLLNFRSQAKKYVVFSDSTELYFLMWIPFDKYVTKFCHSESLFFIFLLQVGLMVIACIAEFEPVPH